MDGLPTPSTLHDMDGLPTPSTLHDMDGLPMTSPAEIANSFNAYFSNTGCELAKKKKYSML